MSRLRKKRTHEQEREICRQFFYTDIPVEEIMKAWSLSRSGLMRITGGTTKRGTKLQIERSYAG